MTSRRDLFISLIRDSLGTNDNAAGPNVVINGPVHITINVTAGKKSPDSLSEEDLTSRTSSLHGQALRSAAENLARLASLPPFDAKKTERASTP